MAIGTSGSRDMCLHPNSVGTNGIGTCGVGTYVVGTCWIGTYVLEPAIPLPDLETYGQGLCGTLTIALSSPRFGGCFAPVEQEH